MEVLRSGHLGGACLDVFVLREEGTLWNHVESSKQKEPLPPESPLWEMPNVLVSPHSASTSNRENERLTDLFCDNLRRFLNDEPLLNVLDTERLY